MPTIPLFILLIGFFFRKSKYILVLLVLANLPFLRSSITVNQVDGHAQAITRFVSTRAYRELYRSIDFDQRKTLQEKDFINLNESFYESLGTREIKIELIDLETISNKQAEATYDIKYLTKYGFATHQIEVNFYKKYNQWKMVWDWDMLWPKYGPDSHILTEEGTVPLVNLLDQQGKIYSVQGISHMVYVIPRLMFDWTKSLDEFSRLIGKSGLYVDSKVKQVIPDDYPRFIGMLNQKLGPDRVTQAEAIKGVVLKEINYPIVLPDLPQTISAIHYLSELEETNPELFYLQADIFVENDQGERIEIPFTDVVSTNMTF